MLEQSNGILAGIDVNAKDQVSADDFKGLKELQAKTIEDFACDIVLYRGKNAIPFGEKLWVIPISHLLHRRMNS